MKINMDSIIQRVIEIASEEGSEKVLKYKTGIVYDLDDAIAKVLEEIGDELDRNIELIERETNESIRDSVDSTIEFEAEQKSFERDR